MSNYRKIHYPKCPYCGEKCVPFFNSYDYCRLVGMATSHKDDDVVIQCDHCGKRYRVTCSIKYSARKLKE